MIKTDGTTVTVEWFNTNTGSWANLGEASSLVAAERRIAGLRAADTEPERYRICETTYYEDAEIVLG